MCDGTRQSTVRDIKDIWQVVKERIGEVPAVVALNKADLEDWHIDAQHTAYFEEQGWQTFETSAKEGQNVKALFEALITEVG